MRRRGTDPEACLALEVRDEDGRVIDSVTVVDLAATSLSRHIDLSELVGDPASTTVE